MKIHWHTWSKWSAPYCIGLDARQEKRCLTCNKATSRRVWGWVRVQEHEKENLTSVPIQVQP